jgi:hypothetical protein
MKKRFQRVAKFDARGCIRGSCFEMPTEQATTSSSTVRGLYPAPGAAKSVLVLARPRWTQDSDSMQISE